MVLQDGYCEKCCNQYTNTLEYWCKPCLINSLKEKFVNWTSGNEIIDQFIQEMQLTIDSCYDIIFEWVPYNQLDNIKKIVKIDSITVDSAIWMDGPLNYYEHKYVRNQQHGKVVLKCLPDSQNISSEFLNEV
jgi:hypothetical protein